MSVHRTVNSQPTDKGACGRPLRTDETATGPVSGHPGTLIENVEERTVAVTPLLADILHKFRIVSRRNGPGK